MSNYLFSRLYTRSALLGAISSVLFSPLFGQGGLEPPPGVPEPSMKSLAQIEARAPISEPALIDQPGSYYLTNNIEVESGHAFTIAADGVTLDLNGFTIRSIAEPADGRGVFLQGNRQNITILNGFIVGGVINNSGSYEGPGFGAGIYSEDADAAENIVVRNISVSGCQNNGIHLGKLPGTVRKSSLVESCTVSTVGHYGIFASIIKNCVATDCGDGAIFGDQVSDCRGESDQGFGVQAEIARDCTGWSVQGKGVEAAIARNCMGNSYSATSIGLKATSLAIGCYGYSSWGTGLEAPIANSCVGATQSGVAQNITHRYNMP